MELNHNVAPSEQTARAVSAAMDEPEALAELQSSQDPQTLHQTWQRYHLIGEALRDELPQQLDLQFSERVAAAVMLEPAYSEPTIEQATEQAVTKTGLLEQLMNWLSRPVAQVAVASSVAIVAILGVQSLEGEPEPGSLSVLPTIPLAPATPVSMELAPQESAEPVEFQSQAPEPSEADSGSGSDNDELAEPAAKLVH